VIRSDEHSAPKGDGGANCACNKHKFLHGTFYLALITAAATGWYAITAKDSERRSLRAYLSLSDPPATNALANRLEVFAEDQNLKARQYLLNAGQTPAYGIKIDAGVVVAPAPLPESYVFPDRDNSPAGVLSPRQPLTVLPSSDKPLTHDEFSSVKAGTSAVYVYGGASYQDVWGYPHYLKFCVWYRNPNDTSSTFCQGRNDADRD
jgi:hypothetical protein